jgi:flagellar hook-associated protein 1 FlgK
MLTQQRESVSGVSIDEEVSNLTVYQRAYEANARMISVVDELLTTLIGLGTGVP